MAGIGGCQIFRGHDVKDEGPDGEKPSLGLSPFLRSLGIETFRLKTGTPPRIKRDSIDYGAGFVHVDVRSLCT